MANGANDDSIGRCFNFVKHAKFTDSKLPHRSIVLPGRPQPDEYLLGLGWGCRLVFEVFIDSIENQSAIARAECLQVTNDGFGKLNIEHSFADLGPRHALYRNGAKWGAWQHLDGHYLRP